MAFQTFNPMGVLGQQDFAQPNDAFGNFFKGYGMSFLPEQLKQQQLAEQLQNQILGTKAQYAQPQAQAGLEAQQFANAINQKYGERKQQLDIEKLQADILKAQNEAPLGGLTGDLGNAVRLEMMKSRLGEDSPIYQAAKQQHDIQTQTRQIQNELNKMYIDTAPKRFSTPQGKRQLEQRDVEMGFYPGTMDSANPIPLEPQQQQILADQYANIQRIQSSDSQARQQEIFATNIDKTLGMIDVDALTQYSGAQGQAKLKADQALAALGRAPDRYRKYTNALVNAEVLASQVRAFYKDSVSPKMMERLDSLTNPSGLLKSPDVAKSNFNALKELLDAETKTYREATRRPAPELAEQFAQQISKPASKPLSKWTDEELLQGYSNAD